MTIHQDWNRSNAAKVAALAPPLVSGLDTESLLPAKPVMPLGKRLFDIVASIILLIPLSVVMLIVAILHKLIEGGPLLYRAQRMRAPGQAFTQLKFRTMIRDEADFGATGAHKNWRITPFGHFLRRTRIDELPQLFNILRGDMSFVGPRPPLPEYVERFPLHYARVLRCRPGATGLATLIYHRHEDRIMANCRSAEATEAAYYRRCLPAKLKIDSIYQEQRTLGMDLWIIWNTIKVVVLRDERPRRRHH